ncbi:hypothetical protein [Aerosakkonema funiforme]|uniref:hypothetical protein n=1 Tax=Aerosakkonema funiforme TaxID=1246630 RepID=UPI0035B9A34D
MNAKQLLEKVQFVVDAEGNKSAVQLSVELWEELLTILEDLEDAEEIRLARENKEKGDEKRSKILDELIQMSQEAGFYE